MLLQLAWRNLFRNRRRTGLTSGAVAFAVMLMVFAISLNEGAYEVMIDNGTRMLSGHLQLFADGYEDKPRVRDRLRGVDALVAELTAVPGVAAVLPRAESFAVLSVDDKSFGARIIGVDPERERGQSLLPDMIVEGRYLGNGDQAEAVIGAALARNLSVTLGGELVVLGSDPEGSVAAMVATVVGILDTGLPELDRAVAQVQLAHFQDAFYMEDSAHRLVLMLDELHDADALSLRLAAQVPPGVEVRPWAELLPEIAQSIEFDRVSNGLFYVLLGVMVTFSVVNTFMMIVFERTRELGIMEALGAPPGRIFALLQLEALFMALLGVGVGAVLAALLVLTLGQVGISFGDEAGQLLAQYHMPERLYPTLVPAAFFFPIVFVTLAIQVAALVPALRLRRLDPVEALRFE